jgi:hypothetical protein
LWSDPSYPLYLFDSLTVIGPFPIDGSTQSNDLDDQSWQVDQSRQRAFADRRDHLCHNGSQSHQQISEPVSLRVAHHVDELAAVTAPVTLPLQLWGGLPTATAMVVDTASRDEADLVAVGTGPPAEIDLFVEGEEDRVEPADLFKRTPA